MIKATFLLYYRFIKFK